MPLCDEPLAATARASVDESQVLIEPLGSHYNRAAFSCGEPALDGYIRRQASQDVRGRIAQVFFAVADRPGELAGFYTLSASRLEKDALPVELYRRLPHYPVPAA